MSEAVAREDGDTVPWSPGGAVRAMAGGALMGLANLVPGISGGTMLLAVGIYPAFIDAVAEVTTFRLTRRNVWLLGLVAAAAGSAILLLAGPIQRLVIDHRWIMYSLFIGLTLGGVPLVWRLARPGGRHVWQGCAIGLAVMVLMALGLGGTRTGDVNPLLLFSSGLAGASAMILPGISGGYLLLLLGQYEVILGAIDKVKEGLLGDAGFSIDLLTEAAGVVIPVGLGVVAGIVGVSNLLKWAMHRHERTTLGILLGLLVGAVIGLYPFQRGVEPAVGDTVQGQVLTVDTVGEVDPEDWPVEPFRPGPAQVAGSLALIAAGFPATRGIDRLGRSGKR